MSLPSVEGCRNLYVHFPFCRRKCSYCALHSRVGVSVADRDGYVRRLARAVAGLPEALAGRLETVYFGGGSPALCELEPLFSALRPLLAGSGRVEFTVELHPLDVTDDLLERLRMGGVNRISMGVQSLDDAVLRQMRRGYDAVGAERAFACVRRHFDNAGIDLIVGYPGEPDDWSGIGARLGSWGLSHCSVYSLILEEKSLLARWLQKGDATGLTGSLPTDGQTMDRLAAVAEGLRTLGLERYEISSYALRGRECRHNLAVWRGEDYLGLGEGAFGRLGLARTRHAWGADDVAWGLPTEIELVKPERDRQERRLFRLRTREGLDAGGRPDWQRSLVKFEAEGLLRREGDVFFLTPRGCEVCDSLLVDLV